MPEGDAVARVARQLTSALADGPLVRAELRWGAVSDAGLVGRRSLGTATYGKHLLTRFDDGRTLHTHLRMDGMWRLRPTPVSTGWRGGPDIRAVLATSEWTAWGHGLGELALLRTRDEGRLLARLGPDLMAVDAESNLVEAAAKMARDARGIGEVLLDQTVAAGIGTIWASETLFRHGVSPWRRAAQADGAAILTTASRLMRASAAAESFPARYLPAKTHVPLGVYDRERLACPRCAAPIARGVVGQAPTARRIFYCPRCQAP